MTMDDLQKIVNEFIWSDLKPKSIKAFLDEYVIGQDEAKKALSVAAYNHIKRMRFNSGLQLKKNFEYLNDVKVDKSNLLLIGGTGTGKTYLVKTLAKLLCVPCYIGDATSLTESGYVGNDCESLLSGLLSEANFDVELAQKGIICIDEIDKLRKQDSSRVRDVGGEGVQQALLKILEGNVVGVPPQGGRKRPDQTLIQMDTSNILFIGTGAFPGLKENPVKKGAARRQVGFTASESKLAISSEPQPDILPDELVRFGMIPEFIGRFPIITHTEDLKEEDLLRIIKEPKDNVLLQYKKLLALDKITLQFDDDALKEIAHIAFKMHTGARGVRGIMERILNDIMFEYADRKNETVVIDREFVLSNFTKQGQADVLGEVA